MSNIEKSTLEKINKLRAEYVRSLLHRFAELNQAYVAIIESGASQEYIRTLEVLSHTLCGSAGTFGYGDIAAYCRRIEGLCNLLDSDEVVHSQSMKQISKTLSQLEEAMLAPRLVAESQVLEIGDVRNVKSVEKLLYVLDYDESHAEQLKNKVESYGYKIKVFHQLDDFFGAIEVEVPEAIIIDKVVGNDDGIAALSFLNNRLPFHIPSILMSAEDNFETRLATVKAGADAFIRKPFDANDVVDNLEILIGDKNTEPYKVLIVDDIESMLDYYRIILERAGMECVTISNPEIIMQILVDFEPELILMDLHMPTCRGDELAKLIHQEKKYAGLPIVYLSSETNVKEQLAALQMAGDGFLIKPIRPSHLTSAISSRARRFRRIKSFMQNDSLTGIYNHSSLKMALERELSRSLRTQAPFCFAMIDIDYFKQINDRFGHAAGDMVLKNVAWLFKKRLRITDTLGRYGGEEFGIILPETTLEDGEFFINELLQAVRNMEINLNNEIIQVRFSAGVVAYSDDLSVDDLCVAADRLMYEAKISGRNQVRAGQPVEHISSASL